MCNFIIDGDITLDELMASPADSSKPRLRFHHRVFVAGPGDKGCIADGRPVMMIFSKTTGKLRAYVMIPDDDTPVSALLNDESKWTRMTEQSQVRFLFNV